MTLADWVQTALTIVGILASQQPPANESKPTPAVSSDAEPAHPRHNVGIFIILLAGVSLFTCWDDRIAIIAVLVATIGVGLGLRHRRRLSRLTTVGVWINILTLMVASSTSGMVIPVRVFVNNEIIPFIIKLFT